MLRLGKVPVWQNQERLVISLGLKQRALRLAFSLSMIVIAWAAWNGIGTQHVMVFYLLAPVLLLFGLVGLLGALACLTLEADVYDKQARELIRYRGYWPARRRELARHSLRDCQFVSVGPEENNSQPAILLHTEQEKIPLLGYEDQALLALRDFLAVELRLEED